MNEEKSTFDTVSKAQKKAKITAVINRKGGSGKTTTVFLCACNLSAMGKRVLVVDLDYQASATATFLLRNKDIDKSQMKVLDDILWGKANIRDVIVKCPVQKREGEVEYTGIDIIPMKDSSLRYSSEDALALKKVLKEVEGDYDYIIIDMPPDSPHMVEDPLAVKDGKPIKKYNLVTLGLAAADNYIIPAQPTRASFEGVKLLTDNVMGIRRAFNPELRCLGVFISCCQRWSAAVMFAKAYKSLGRLWSGIVIKNSARVSSGVDFATPLSWVYTNDAGAQGYMQVTNLIMKG